MVERSPRYYVKLVKGKLANKEDLEGDFQASLVYYYGIHPIPF